MIGFPQPLFQNTTWRRRESHIDYGIFLKIDLLSSVIFLCEIVLLHYDLHLKYWIWSKSYFAIKLDFIPSKASEITAQKQIKTVIVKNSHNQREKQLSQLKRLLLAACSFRGSIHIYQLQPTSTYFNLFQPTWKKISISTHFNLP